MAALRARGRAEIAARCTASRQPHGDCRCRAGDRRRVPAMPPMPPMPWSDKITVHMDQARLVQLPERAANVVIGNPLIADVSIQPGGLTVITGKSYGATNFIATDKSGAVLLEKSIEVTGPRDRTAGHV